MTQHSTLSIERWQTFPLEQQLLMIANEMNRAAKLLGEVDRTRRENSYERVLQLTDLTVRANASTGLRRELLRWRGLVAERYVGGISDVSGHRALLRALLLLHPRAALQLPFVA